MTDRLVKVEGAGNDFVLAMGGWLQRLAADPALVRRLCHRRLGIGADGVLLVEVEGADRVRLDHRNPDGSTGPFCGNGTRCAARVAVELGGCRPDLVVVTDWAQVRAAVREDTVSLELPPPAHGPRPVTVPVGDRSVEACALEVGVPHLVVEVDDVDRLDLTTIAPPLRHHPSLGAGGANVDFVTAADKGRLRIRTWERGVEGETLSCGSGVVAAALVVMARRQVRVVELRPTSGDVLIVEALATPPRCPVRLTGPARIVAEVHPSEAWLRGRPAS